MRAIRRTSSADPSAGFTLIEVMTVSLMIVTLMALAYAPLRNFWFKQSLEGASNEMIAEVRSLQSRVTAESHPLVYGIRFTTQGNWMATGRWGLVKYDPTGGVGGAPACTQYATASFDAGVFNATVEIVTPAFTASTEQTFCRTALKNTSGASLAADSDQFVFLYARGTATGGTLKLHQARLGSSRDITVQIYPLTGRIERL